jgi:hypothetical protein
VQWVELYTSLGSGAILDCPAGWVAAGSDLNYGNTDQTAGVWQKDYVSLGMNPTTGDSVVTTNLFSAAYSVDTISCWFMAPSDISFSRELNTTVGLVEHCISLSGQLYANCTTLIGYRIGGEVNGPIALSMREHNSSAETPKLFPNPVNDLLFIRGDHSGQPRMCEVIDASGKVVLTTQYLGDGISVSDMPKGIYVLRIHDISGQQHARFVKY